MVFSSLEFIFLFLPVTLAGFFVLKHIQHDSSAKWWLILCSFFFYSYWNPIYLPLILLSIVGNYYLGEIISRHQSMASVAEHTHLAKRYLAIGIVLNLATLGWFKYADFLVRNLNILGLYELPEPNIILPLAISFFTFQQIAYLIDMHKGEVDRHGLVNYTLFVTFFPQLIAGPIVHHKEMMPQFRTHVGGDSLRRKQAQGLFIFAVGLFKKVVIADTLSVWAQQGFTHTAPLTFIDAWATSLSYTFQIYYDFSGYSDMAIGLALLFGIKLPLNFFSPYKASDIQDFWRRWHMTLARWLGDYLYRPLGGNRNGTILTARNVLITFILGGLWHGAGWYYVIWGGLNGLAIIVYRYWKSLGYQMPKALGWAVTFLFIHITMLVFGAESLSVTQMVLEGMLGLNGFALSEEYALVQALFALPETSKLVIPSYAFLGILFAAFLSFCAPNSIELSHYAADDDLAKGAILTPYHAVFAAIISAIAVVYLLISPGDVFLYYNF